MLARPQRRGRPGPVRHFARPQAGAHRHRVAGDAPARGLDRRDAPATGDDAGHAAVLKQPRAGRARAFHQRRAYIGRTDAAVARAEHRAAYIRGVHQRPERGGLGRGDEARVDAERMRQRFLAANVNQAVGVGGDGQRAALHPAACLAGLRFQPRIQVDGILNHAGQVARVAQRPHLRRGMPSAAGGESVALHQHRIADAEPAQVIQRRAAHNAAADDHHRGLRRRGGGAFIGGGHVGGGESGLMSNGAPNAGGAGRWRRRDGVAMRAGRVSNARINRGS